MPTFTIWYMKPGCFAEFAFGKEPEVAKLEQTHIKLMDRLAAENLEDVFVKMQGENWSPNGEARPFIEALGLAHTSISVGDVVYEPDTDKHWVVAMIGFKRIR